MVDAGLQTSPQNEATDLEASPGQTPGPSLSKIFLPATLLVVVTLGVIALIYFFVSSQAPSYKKLETYKSTADESGRRFTVQYPDAMEKVQGTEGSVVLEDGSEVASQPPNSQITVRSLYVGSATAEQVAAELKAKKQSDLKSLIIENAALDTKTTTIGSIKTVRNSGTRGGYAASYELKDSKRLHQPVKGEVLLLVGEDRIYTVTVNAKAKVWEKNQTMLEKVGQSFKTTQP